MGTTSPLAQCEARFWGKEADDSVHEGGHFLGGVVGGQLILDAVADVGGHPGDQSDEAGEEGVQDEEENSLEADVFQTNGVAQIGDAGNDAEDQQRDDHRRDDVGIDRAHSGHIDVMALEREAHDEAEAHRQNGAHAEVHVLFLVQIIQQGKKYSSQGQCGQIQNFYRHKTDAPLLSEWDVVFVCQHIRSLMMFLPFSTNLLCMYVCSVAVEYTTSRSGCQANYEKTLNFTLKRRSSFAALSSARLTFSLWLHIIELRKRAPFAHMVLPKAARSPYGTANTEGASCFAKS